MALLNEALNGDRAAARPGGLAAMADDLAKAQVLAVRRFDRADPSGRVQIEDFTQLLGLCPDEKYSRADVDVVAKSACALAGVDGLKRTVRRLVFMLACGNGDAHLKNWRLIYPDGLVASMSPGDLVSTIQYLPDDSLALNPGKSKARGGGRGLRSDLDRMAFADIGVWLRCARAQHDGNARTPCACV